MTHQDTYRPRPRFGYVRTLSQQEELPLLRDHLLRLDPESRHDQFNGFLDDSFIERYAARCAADGTIIVAYMEDGYRARSRRAASTGALRGLGSRDRLQR